MVINKESFYTGIKKIMRISITVTLFYSCTKKQEKTKPVKENIVETVYASGFVKSSNQYEVFSPVTGLVKKIFVKEGDQVKKDDPILQVKAETALLNIEQARLAAENSSFGTNNNRLLELQTNINSLINKMKNDSLLLMRQKNLWKQDIGSRAELDLRELAYKNARSAYNAAVFSYRDLEKQIKFASDQSKNNLAISKTQAGEYTVRSRISGTVFSINKKEAEMVSPQVSVAVIGGTDNFILELQVDEYDIEKLSLGQKVLFSMDSYKGSVFEGKVSRIIPYMNERTKSFTIEAEFVTYPKLLYPNLSAEANIVMGTKMNALTIPREYLVNDSTVLLLNGKAQKIKIGLKDYIKVEIISGLSSGDEIIKPGL